MATGGRSLEEGDLSRLVENLALIENQRADAYRTPKIPIFFAKIRYHF